MNDILLKKEKLIELKNKYLKKLFIIENDLINIEKELSKFCENEIVESLTLSPNQQQIVDATEQNILCLACAGSGKTHTLISRYINLVLKKDVLPESVLLITFTKKAGQEMLDRLEMVIPNKLPFHTGSLHGLSFKILQKYNNINYTILDEIDTKKLLELETHNILLEENVDEPELIKKNIFVIYNKASTTYPINYRVILKKENMVKYLSIVNKIMKSYGRRKKQENLLDFNDLMIYFCNFLKSNKSDEFKNQIKYIFFDEYQDVNPIQNTILNTFKNIANIMVVGDDAQAIYSFRGSTIQCIMDFPNNFLPNNKYLLEENYRSTPYIVNFCQNIIEKNRNQYKKKVISKQTEMGMKPDIHAFNNTSYEDQYIWVVNDIIDKYNKKVSLSDIVILARKNDSLDKIEMILNNSGLPNTKLAGRSLLDRPHIRDFIAFIIILYNPKSSIHWKRILYLHFNDINLANQIVENNDMKNNEKLVDLYKIIEQINETYADLDKAKLILSYLDKIWNNKYINDRKDFNIILSYLKNFPCSLKQLIDNIFLNKDLSNFENEGVCLSTIHGSKGLEWAYVYIIDVNSNDFPSIKQQFFKDEIECLEEERRLFYVACSRAKKFLTITYHTSNSIGISPFIRELDDSLYYGNQVYVDNTNNIDYNKLINLDVKEKQIHNEFPIISYKKKKSHNTYFNNLIFKIIHNNFKIKNFDSVYKNNNKKVYYEYIDEQNHWSNLLNIIFEKDTDILINDQTFEFYKNMEIGLKKLLEPYKLKMIQISNNDILIDDNLIVIDDYCSIKTMNRIFNTYNTLSKIYVYNLLEGIVYIITL